MTLTHLKTSHNEPQQSHQTRTDGAFSVQLRAGRPPAGGGQFMSTQVERPMAEFNHQTCFIDSVTAVIDYWLTDQFVEFLKAKLIRLRAVTPKQVSVSHLKLHTDR